MSDKKPNPIDKHVGSKIRMRRNMLQLSQEKLGDQIGVTFQQIQKYERGLNRVGASRLKSIADVLDVDVTFFFAERSATSNLAGFAEGSVPLEEPYLEFCSSLEGTQLITSFDSIKDISLRKKILDLVKATSELYSKRVSEPKEDKVTPKVTAIKTEY
ncbi:helix-turn-helix transcriptional regulator [Bartonella sp. TP]|uniref:helix-turn-helix domain-containing protein n=1 Tax=Bartonella sp. TP TaxID=3057550 RepID=UPI0025B0BB6D|nr:helix-turn-helix transcriptional regulator [Bartonella sp. TP]WJW80393.1 helix-turn-helix transcriptional regulator [Bartonella sp. TP]